MEQKSSSPTSTSSSITTTTQTPEEAKSSSEKAYIALVPSLLTKLEWSISSAKEDFTQKVWDSVQKDKDTPAEFRNWVKSMSRSTQDTETGMTPLLFAAQNGHVDRVKILLEEGEDPNLANRQGMTPLMYASMKNNADMVKVFLQMHKSGKIKINFDLKNQSKDTVFMLAAKNRVEEIYDAFYAMFSGNSSALETVVRPLINSGNCERLKKLPTTFNVSEVKFVGQSPVIGAAKKGDHKMVRFLIDNKIWFGITGGKDKTTALIEAAKNGHAEVVEELLKNKGQFIAKAEGCYLNSRQLREDVDNENIGAECPMVFYTTSGIGVARLVGNVIYLDNLYSCKEKVSDGMNWVSGEIFSFLKAHSTHEENLIQDVQGEFFALQAALGHGHTKIVEKLLKYNPRLKSYSFHEAVYNAAINASSEILDFYLLGKEPEVLNEPRYLVDKTKKISHLAKAYREGQYIGVQFLISRGADERVLQGEVPLRNKDKTQKSLLFMQGIRDKNLTLIEAALEANLTINLEHIKYAIKTIEKPEKSDEKFYSSLDKTLNCLIEHCWAEEVRARKTDHNGLTMTSEDYASSTYRNGLKMIAEGLKEKRIVIEKETLPQLFEKMYPPAPSSTSESKSGPFISEILYTSLPSAPRAEGEPEPIAQFTTLPGSSSSSSTTTTADIKETNNTDDSLPLNLWGIEKFVMGPAQVNATEQLWKVVQADKDAPDEVKKWVAKSNINVQDSETRMTPLLWAVQKGHINSVRILLAAGADPNIAGKENMTPLMYASMRDSAEMVNVFLEDEKRCKFDLKNRDGNTAFMLAAQNKTKATYDALYPTFCTNTSALENVIPALVDSGDCKRLGQLSIKLSEVKNVGDPLVIRAAKNNKPEMVKFLIKQGVQSGLIGGSTKNTTALIEAAKEGHIEVVQVLLEEENNDSFVKIAGGCYLNTGKVKGNYRRVSEIKIDNQNVRKQLPIVFSWNCKEFGTTKMAFGVVSMSGEALSVVDLGYNGKISNGLMWVDNGVYRQLKSYAKNSIQDVQGEFFALQAAVAHGHTEVVQALLKHNAWLKHYQDLGKTPLVQLAIEKGHFEIMKALWDEHRGYDIDQFQILAAQKGHIEIVKFLFSILKDGQTIPGEAIYNAVINGYDAVLDFYMEETTLKFNPDGYLAEPYQKGQYMAVQRLILRGANPDVLTGMPSTNVEATRQTVTLMQGIADRNEHLINGAIRKGKLNISLEHIEYAIKKADEKSYPSLDDTLICLMEHCWGAKARTDDAYKDGLKSISDVLAEKGLDKDKLKDKLPKVFERINPPAPEPFIAQILEHKEGKKSYADMLSDWEVEPGGQHTSTETGELEATQEGSSALSSAPRLDSPVRLSEVPRVRLDLSKVQGEPRPTQNPHCGEQGDVTIAQNNIVILT